jgi:hypothetical protein
MTLRRVLPPLLLVACVIATGCGGDDGEKQTGATTTGAAQFGDEPAAARSNRSRDNGTLTSGSTSRPLAAGGARANRKPAYRLLRDGVVGYSLRYPRDWKLARRPAGATAFAKGARCRSVEIVDFAPPSGSGQAGPAILHSFVQVCAKRVKDGLSIDEFMRRTYKDVLSKQFATTKFAGVRAYRSRLEDQDLIFLQTDAYRIQIYTAVVADREKRAKRQAQVRGVLGSFTLVRP